jgi:glutaredoxin
MKQMKQQCYLWSVWLTWIGLPALALAVGFLKSWWAAVLVLLVGVSAQVIFIRVFPRLSSWLGYGSVENVPAEPSPQAGAISKVTLYTANVCPFCPIVKKRLVELQDKLTFEFEELDITFRQDLIKQKGFRSVPVIEVDGRYRVGNATSAQLAAFLTEGQR